MKILSLVIAIAASLVGGPAAAQSADDWDQGAPAEGTTMASVAFDGGAAIAVRCAAGKLDVLIAGAPASATATTREVTVTMPGVAAEKQTWLAQPGAPVMSPSEPARMARMLRSGGNLNLLVAPEAEGGRPARLAMDYPASSAAIDRVLEACHAPLTSDLDTVPRAAGHSPVWEKLGDTQFPTEAANRGIHSGSAELGCLVLPDGTHERCWVESETPEGVGFGDAAVRGLRTARFGPASVPADSAVVVRFTMRFRTD